MTITQQRADLHAKLWQISNSVRGAVDGWDFRQFVLGALFYRFLSENFARYMQGGEDLDYASMNFRFLPDDIVNDVIYDTIKTKGYFIFPGQLFANVVAEADSNEHLAADLADIFSAIERSAEGTPSEGALKGLFSGFDTTSPRLGHTAAQRNERLAIVLKGIASLDFGDFEDSSIDLFGDAYEFLISKYAANAGKSGGEFFTPQQASKLVAQLALQGQESINGIYDPTCGSGSLLLQAKKQLNKHRIENGFFGQEMNHTTYNLARMNMFLHNVNYTQFHLRLDDTLRRPHLAEMSPFDAIVSNPPYSVKWAGDSDPALLGDDRFADVGVLPPKSKADFAFVLHALHYLSDKGRAAIVCFPGIFYRGGTEQKIRQYLVEHNNVEAVIALAPNLFYGTCIATNILVLSKHKPDGTTQFIDASGLFKKDGNKNVLLDEHIARIMDVFASKEDVPHFARSVTAQEIREHDFNLSVSAYVQPEDKREVFDPEAAAVQLRHADAQQAKARREWEDLVNELEGRPTIGMTIRDPADPAPVFQLTLPGALPGKIRPRFSRKTGRVYTDAKTVAAERTIRRTAQAGHGAPCLKGPLKVMLELGVPVPVSWSAAKRKAAMDGILHPTARPDVDNVSKLVLDALNGVLWCDDAQVCELHVRRRYMAEPETKMAVIQLGKKA